MSLSCGANPEVLRPDSSLQVRRIRIDPSRRLRLPTHGPCRRSKEKTYPLIIRKVNKNLPGRLAFLDLVLVGFSVLSITRLFDANLLQIQTQIDVRE